MIQKKNTKNKLSKKKLIIFDYDGTIADTNELHSRAFKYVLKDYLKNFEYSSISGCKTFDALKICFEKNKVNLSNEEIQKLVKKKQSKFKSLAEKYIKPIDGVEDFLIWADKKYRLTIASSGSRDNVMLGIEIMGYKDYFEYILCAEDVLEAKPSPMIFEKILLLTKINKDEAIIIEDSAKGIEAAKKSQIDYVDLRDITFNELINCK